MEAWERAEGEYDRLMENAAFRNKERHYWRARIAIGRERFEEAISDILKAPRSEAARLRSLLARAYAGTGREEEALHIAWAISEAKDGETQFALGEVYAALEMHEQALACYERASRRKDAAETVFRLAMMLVALDEDQEACSLLQQAIARAPYQHPGYLRALAACCRRLGRDAEAGEAEALARRAEDAG